MIDVPHGVHGSPSIEHWTWPSGMSENSSKVAVPLFDSTGGPERIETCGAIPVLAAAMANIGAVERTSASSVAQIVPVNGLLVSVTSAHVEPSSCSSRTAVVA